MLGLLNFGIIILYIAICYGFTLYVIRRSKSKSILKGLVAFLIYNTPLGWQLIPPIIMQANACEQDSGFTLYKTPEQWKLENPDVASTLIRPKRPDQSNKKIGEWHNQRIFHLNQRFDWVNDYITVNNNLAKIQETVVDVKTKEIMAKRVDFIIINGLSLFGGSTGISSGCFNKEERSKWLVNGAGFSKNKIKFKRLGE
jgi:hypothetical protein